MLNSFQLLNKKSILLGFSLGILEIARHLTLPLLSISITIPDLIRLSKNLLKTFISF